MQRLGRTHRPFYRINAVDVRVKRDGKVIERLGWYNPVEQDPEKQVHLESDRIKDWLARGARPSDTVMDILGHRELLGEKLKAEWEATRETGMARGRCKAAIKSIESAIADLEKMAKDAEDPDALTPLINASKRSLNDAKRTVALAKADDAESAAKVAQDSLASATSTMEAAAKKKAEEDAAAAKAAEAEAAAAAEAGEGENAEAETAES